MIGSWKIIAPGVRAEAKLTMLPLPTGTVRHMSSIDWCVVNSARRYRSEPAWPSAMTAPAPALRNAAAKLSARCRATATVGSGLPGSELPEA